MNVSEIAGIFFCGHEARILMVPDEIKCLAAYASKAAKAAVEIGTFKGGSAAVISNALPRGARLYTVDPYIPDSKYSYLHGNYWTALAQVARHGKLGKVTLIRGTSAEAASRWKLPLDLLWIDGSHHYEDVKNDFLLWSRFVRSGGHILFHDSNRADLSSDAELTDYGWCGPTRVCNEIKKDGKEFYEHVESVLSINVFKKK